MTMWSTLSTIVLLAVVIPPFLSVHGQDCTKNADLFFVIDGSESVKQPDFIASKTFVIDVLEEFDVGLNAVHIGANVFGTRVYDGINLFGPTRYPLLKARLRTLKRSKLGTTLTNIAIEDMREQFQKRGRTDVPWVGIVITDGKSVDIRATEDQARLARNEGINMIAVGVGEVFRDPAQAAVTMAELENIAGDMTDPAQAAVTMAELENIAGDMTSVRHTLDISLLVDEIRALIKSYICPPFQVTTTAATQPTTTPDSVTTTVATTAAAATQPTTTPDSGALQRAIDCTDCMIDEHHGYWKHPNTCEKFIRIFSDENGTRTTGVQKCEPGLFWSQDVLTCVLPEMVECDNDPCKNTAVASYDVEEKCSSYIQCINGKSYYACCSPGDAYVAGQGCRTDATCEFDCYSGDELDSLLAPADCPSRRHPTDPQLYIEDVPGFGNMTRPCPTYTSFNNSACACTLDPAVWVGNTNQCRAVADFPLTADFLDNSDDRSYAGSQLVSIENGAAQFNGDGMVNFYRFAKDDFGQQLTMRFTFKADTPVKSVEALLTNCIYGITEQSSIAITVHRGPSGASKLKIRTDTDVATASIDLPFDPTIEHELIYIYDGSKLIGAVNGQKVETDLTGNIFLSTSGIILGAGTDADFFHGSIKQFELYKCWPAFTDSLRI